MLDVVARPAPDARRPAGAYAVMAVAGALAAIGVLVLVRHDRHRGALFDGRRLLAGLAGVVIIAVAVGTLDALVTRPRHGRLVGLANAALGVASLMALPVAAAAPDGVALCATVLCLSAAVGLGCLLPGVRAWLESGAALDADERRAETRRRSAALQRVAAPLRVLGLTAVLVAVALFYLGPGIPNGPTAADLGHRVDAMRLEVALGEFASQATTQRRLLSPAREVRTWVVEDSVDEVRAVVRPAVEGMRVTQESGTRIDAERCRARDIRPRRACYLRVRIELRQVALDVVEVTVTATAS